MNWVGGSRARAKFQKPLAQPPGRVGFNRPNAVESTDAEGDNSSSVPGSIPGRVTMPTGAGETRGRRSHRQNENLFQRQNDINYSDLGFHLVTPQPKPRRIVPLLELAEKNFPFGHILSLHLDFVMDITRAPFPVPVSHDNAVSESALPYSPSDIPLPLSCSSWNERLDISSSAGGRSTTSTTTTRPEHASSYFD